LPFQAGSILSRACPVSFPHRNVCCIHGSKNREAFNVPYSKLV
jgi:hypothetical protein